MIDVSAKNKTTQGTVEKACMYITDKNIYLIFYVG